MKAMIYRAYGGPERLEPAVLPVPAPGPGQLQLRVVCSGVNPVDWKRASGVYRWLIPVTFPSVPGFDVAGEVSALGPGVAGFRVGQRVHARIAEASGGGCAEFAVAGIDVCAPIPGGMGWAEAAGLPLAGMTALQGLRDEAHLPMEGARERVLVIGASGGVGHLAVQIARATGATVVGLCSAKNAAWVAGLGAHEVLDYTQPEAFRGQAPFDVILDCVAGDPSPWMPRLAPRGRYASCMPAPKTFLRGFLNFATAQRVRPVMLKSRAEDLLFLDRLAEAGKLKVVIDSRFPLESLRAAWERSQSGRAAGKIIVDVAAS